MSHTITCFNYVLHVCVVHSNNNQTITHVLLFARINDGFNQSCYGILENIRPYMVSRQLLLFQ